MSAPAGVELPFSLLHWCLWQSEATPSKQHWPGGQLLRGELDLGFLPMMQRRRLSPLARAACAVAWQCRQRHGDLPAIYYSGHGESHYYFEMLQDIAAGEPVSPSRFSLCVHNAIAGQFSLHTQNHQPYVTLAGGGEGLFGALLEAAGWLLDVSKVMLVAYEQPLPELYQRDLATADNTWALALVLARAGQSGRRLCVWRDAGASALVADHGDLSLIEAIIHDLRDSAACQRGGRWHWQFGDSPDLR